MEIVWGTASIDDVETFVDRLREIGDAHGCTVQAMDARYIAGNTHLELAVALARRARERGEDVADEAHLEVLLYAAGTRQIDRALELGVKHGEGPVAVVVFGRDETAAVRAIRELVEADEELTAPDEERLVSWFDITDRERSATTATVAELVLERVALIEVEK